MNGTEIRSGTIVVHIPTRDVRTVSHRKTTGDGWWLTDGSGLADRVLADGDWVSLPFLCTFYEQSEKS